VNLLESPTSITSDTSNVSGFTPAEAVDGIQNNSSNGYFSTANTYPVTLEIEVATPIESIAEVGMSHYLNNANIDRSVQAFDVLTSTDGTNYLSIGSFTVPAQNAYTAGEFYRFAT